MKRIVGLATFAVLLLFTTPTAGAQETAFSKQFLQQYCVACHNDANRTANISVTPLDPDNVALHADVWEKVLRKVRTAEMPPPNMPQPAASSSAEFTSELQLALDTAAAAKPDPGRTTIHRLNRIEYANSVRDLLAIELDADDSLPADDTGYGFDNIADVLSVSPILLERYMAVARKVSRLAVGSTDITPGQEAWRLERKGNNRLGTQRVSDDLPFGSRGGMSTTYYFPVDAEYVIEFDIRLNEFPQEKPYQIRLPMTAGNHTVAATFFDNSARMEMASPPNRRQRGAATLPETAKLDVRIDGKRYKLEELTIDDRQPQVYATYIEGPYNITGPGNTPSRKMIFSCNPSTAADEEPCAREILTRLARRAYRRPVTNDDVSPLMGIYQIGHRGGDFDAGIQRALEAMLVSPNFLFRVERDPAGAKPGEIRKISDLELASRLSFFLWSSIPDEELLSLAERGDLREPGVLRAQVKRMIGDQRASSLIENFAGQWLFLRRVDTTTPDADQFGSFDNTLREAMRRETELLFEEVLKEDRSILELLSADYTYLNEQLAEHYGVDGVYGPQMRRVDVSNPNRYGLLGHASILTVTSYANRTSVVQRGAWILDNLLGTPPPPPPPNVPELEAASADGKKRTLRQAMEAHRSNAICASCHARMDPIGFALENFDAIGRWRDDDDGDPIDTSGKLPDGTEFDGPQGLRNLMLDDYKKDFVAAATDKLLTYALGRGLEHYDKPIVRSIMRDTADTGYRMGDLIMKVVESTPFQMRRTTEQ